MLVFMNMMQTLLFQGCGEREMEKERGREEKGKFLQGTADEDKGGECTDRY